MLCALFPKSLACRPRRSSHPCAMLPPQPTQSLCFPLWNHSSEVLKRSAPRTHCVWVSPEEQLKVLFQECHFQARQGREMATTPAFRSSDPSAPDVFLAGPNGRSSSLSEQAVSAPVGDAALRNATHALCIACKGLSHNYDQVSFGTRPLQVHENGTVLQISVGSGNVDV